MTTQTQVQLQDGAEYIGRPVNPEYGKVAGTGKMEIRLHMEIIEGPLTGRRIKYTANTKDQRATVYAKRDLKAAGWSGSDIKTFVDDVNKMSASGAKLPFTVRLARNPKEDGTVSEWWTVNTIGSYSVPLASASGDDDELVNSWFAETNDQSPPAGEQRQTQQPQRTTPQHSTTSQQTQHQRAANNHPNAPGRAPF